MSCSALGKLPKAVSLSPFSRLPLYKSPLPALLRLQVCVKHGSSILAAPEDLNYFLQAPGCDRCRLRADFLLWEALFPPSQPLPPQDPATIFSHPDDRSSDHLSAPLRAFMWLFVNVRIKSRLFNRPMTPLLTWPLPSVPRSTNSEARCAKSHSPLCPFPAV